MLRRKSVCLTAATLAGCATLIAPSMSWAQNAETTSGSASRSRSTNERVGTESVTPPPVNSDYRKAAEGSLPVVPGAIPAPIRGSSDPAARGPLVDTGVAGVNPVRGIILPPGLDAALLIEHAVGVCTESSMLASLASANKPNEAGNDSVKALMAHANEEMAASKELMSRAAAAGANLDANSPVRQFYHAANNYLMTLKTLSEPGLLASPNDQAELASINHAVKAVMDAGHISQFARLGNGSPAMDALFNHARMMKDDGTKTLDRIGGTNPIDPNAPASPIMLAQRGRDLINAAGVLEPMATQMYGSVGAGVNGSIPGQGVNPGRLQNNQVEIIGGTYGTGSQTAGTATGADAARNVKNSTEGPNGVLNVPTPTGAPGTGTSSYGVGNNNTPPTNSTAGSRPR